MVKPTQARSQARMLPWVVWIVAAVFFFFNYMNQVVPSAMAGPLTKAFHIDAAMLGTIAAVYFYIYAVMQIPVGVLVDHFGPHRSLGCAAVLAAAGCLLFSFASTVDMAIVTRMMIGAGASFSFIATLKLIANWFPANRFGTMTGLTNVVGMLGAIVGVGLLTNLTLIMGWRQTVLRLGVVGGILAGLIFFLVRDYPAAASPQPQHQTKRERIGKMLRGLVQIFSTGQNWVNGLYAATINAPYIALGALWGTKYLQTAYLLDKPDAALLSSMIFVGAIPGSFFFGWFSDRIKRRKLPMTVGAAGGLAAISLQLYVPDVSLVASYILFFLLGFFCSGNVVAYALAHDLCPPKLVGVAVGFVSTFLYGVGALFDPLIGWLLSKHAVHGAAHDATSYTRDDFSFALSSLVACLAVTLITSLLIRETRCRSRDAVD